MSDALWAARLGDDLLHTSMMADILGGVLEVAAYAAITVVATAAIVAATGLTVLTGGLGACVLGLVVGVVVGVGMSKTGLDKGLTTLCEGLSNSLFPPTVQAKISSGANKTLINGIPAARAAGKLGNAAAAAGGPQPQDKEQEEEPSFLDMAKSFFSELWQPTVATPAPGVIPMPLDTIQCSKHPPMPPQLLAEGSVKVSIEGQPAVRSGDRATCEATVVDAGTISPNVRIGGDKVVVQSIRSGKTPGVGLALSVLMALRGRPSKLMSNLPCMAMGMVNGFVASQVTGALTRAIAGSPNPVHAATGAKILNDEDDRDFVLPGMLPVEWQRFYSSRDERRNGLFGAGWSVPYEVSVSIEARSEGFKTLIYTDEQGRRIDLGWLAPGDAVYGPGEGLAVRRDEHTGAVLIESTEGLYRLFEVSPNDPNRLRLTKLGDRNDNRLLLAYDDQGRLARIGDGANQIRLELIYASHPQRVVRAERVYADARREVLARYEYDAAGDLSEVFDGDNLLLRRFAYDSQRHMIEHQQTTGQRCFYEWTELTGAAGRERRVARHWTDAGDEYHFAYDLRTGLTRITDSLGRTSERRWNAQHQITRYSDNLGQTWLFEWSDERQLLAASAPDGARWSFAYDESGNLCDSVDPLGRRESIQWLEHWALPVAEVDAQGQGWRYRYDKRGNCTHEIDPLERVTRYLYDDRGLPIRIIDALGNASQLRWNELGQLLERVDCSGYATRFAYDERGHLRTITDALGEHTWYQHDAKGNLLQKQLADGRREQFQRAANGQLLRHIDPAGKATGYQYNRRGQVLSRIDPMGRKVGFEYDAYGRLQSLVNENGESYRFAWDPADRLITQQDLDGSARHYRYDARDELVAVAFTPAAHGTGTLASAPHEPVEPIIHYLERDAASRLVAKSTSDGRTEYSYDALDRLTGVTFADNAGSQQTLGFAYDAVGQLLEEQGSSGSLQHSYDELGNLLETRVPDGRRIRRLYYGSGHLQILSLDETTISHFERDRLHREVLRSQGQLATRSQYDRSGRLTHRLRRRADQPLQLPALAERRFEYDLSDNLISRLDHDPQANRHQRQHLHYDASGRILASQEIPQGRLETYAYDSAANLLDGRTNNAGRVVHNKLVTYQDKRYRYDAFGRLVEKRSGKRQVQRLRYDAEHRLVEVTSHDGVKETRVVMRYDPLGRRIEKHELDSSGRTLGKTDFTWDGMRLLAEEKNGRHSLYLYDEDSYEPLARVDGHGEAARVRYYHNDPNGLPQQLTETDGHCLWQATYQVWGNTITEQYEPYFVEEQNLRFQGQYLDRETGLHYNTFRFYDPDIGRFISPDPIGLAGGHNAYQYADNPIGWSDPFGLMKCSTPPAGRRVNRTVYRFEEPGRISTTWTAHKWNVASTHRYTKPGLGGVYGANSKKTAMAEVTHWKVDLSTRVLVSKKVSLNNVLDLTNPKVRSQLGVSLRDITGSKYNTTHKIGDWAKNNGYDGILAPSARNPTGANLISFGGF
ncbi:MAG: RHS domain-containing protein [Pseudomonas sp.]|nr:RHS domain-containing protein [Pseudomonas sp.]